MEVERSKMEAVSLSSGRTERKMSTDMKREQIGSAISHPSLSTSKEEMITPTLPMVSANTCRNSPVGGAGCHTTIT